VSAGGRSSSHRYVGGKSRRRYCIVSSRRSVWCALSRRQHFSSLNDATLKVWRQVVNITSQSMRTYLLEKTIVLNFIPIPSKTTEPWLFRRRRTTTKYGIMFLLYKVDQSHSDCRCFQICFSAKKRVKY